MDKFLVFSIIVVLFCKHEANSLNLPGPLVYVVTPSPRPPHGDEARAAPFYYHDWMRRMDPPRNATTTTTTTTQKTKTPDLIFAEFESGNKMKSIRKLLEREQLETKTTTTTTRRPIYVAPEMTDVSQDVSYKMPVQSNKKTEDKKPVDMTDYFALYNNQYNPKSANHVPVYKPSTTSTTPSTTTSTTTTTTAPLQDVQNIWHIIDSQKYDQYPGKWEEEPVSSDDTKDTKPEVEKDTTTEDQGQEVDDSFALPGFATNPGNGADNESRAIRTEPNMRFPYVNLKPFQMKTKNKPLLNTISSSKKGSNGFSSVDNFYELKTPVRGESQDVVPMRHPIDRYNPAQPYLPDYGSKSKQSSPTAQSTKDVANLVPPPPAPPRITDDDFPSPSSYESFPPYVPSSPPASPPPPPASPAPKPVFVYQPPVDTSADSGPPDSSSDSDDSPIDLGYRFKPPSPPVESYLPTEPPMSDPFGGYSYDKPPMVDDSPPDMDDKPDFEGYQYSKPEEPSMPQDYVPASYGPEIKPYGPYYPKVIYDFDHDYHHHHYHPTTTTTTTEMPRVNRYSYYYLGKKLYYLPLYFSVYFIVYVGALIIKAVLRHKIVYPNSWRPNDQTAAFFSKRSVDSLDLSNENLHEITGKVTHAIAVAGEKYFAHKKEK